MPISSATPNRKRSRAQIVEDDDLDELSPQKSSKANVTSASTKRRKLATYTSSSAKKGLLGSLGSWSQKLIFGSAQDGKENGMEDQQTDELAEAKDIWDVLSTDDEGKKAGRNSIKEKGSAKKMKMALPNDAKEKPQRRSLAGQLRIDMVGHGSDEDETPNSTPRRAPKSKKGIEPDSASKSISGKSANGEGSTKNKMGRPSKKTLLKNAKAQAREDKRKELGVAESHFSEQAKPTGTDDDRKDGSVDDESLPPSDSEQAVPSSIKIKTQRELNRLGIDMVDSPISSHKGILSPSKKIGGVRPQKSVTFRRSIEDLDLGFKDLPDSATKGKRVRVKTQKVLDSNPNLTPEVKSIPPPLAQEEYENEDPNESDEEVEVEEEETEEPEDRSLMEETACSICAKLDSRKGNQILLCDGCDLAVHQKCYSVPVIPRGDWYCRDCKTQSGEILETKASDLPGIEGFEGHLRMAQRLVLDRLTGQSRIKLCGHDDQSQKVHQVVEQTVLAGEGNSMLVIGARGSGKTTVRYLVVVENYANTMQAC
jgi:origin recognition complex subunit 4